MSPPKPTRIFVIGGTGAQGIPVIQGLVQDGAYSVLALTRDTSSARAQRLLSLGPEGKVSLQEGTFASEAALREGFRKCDGAFVNIDGFNSGEKTEIYWAIRSYEIALEEGIKFFVYGNLDYVYKKSGYDAKFRCGHYDGKGRVGEWILSQNRDNGKRMGAAIFTTGPYIDMTVAAGTPLSPTIEDGVVTWRVPLGDGAVTHVSLEDCAYYVRWLFDHPERSNGLDLEVAIEHVHYADMAKAFTKITGHPAKFVDVELDEYWSSSALSPAADLGAGYNSDPNDPSFMTMRENFTGFWNMWKYSGKNQGVIKRDYTLLDEIHPNRVKTAEQWFREADAQAKESGRGSLWDMVQDLKPILKIIEDGRKGKL